MITSDHAQSEPLVGIDAISSLRRFDAETRFMTTWTSDGLIDRRGRRDGPQNQTVGKHQSIRKGYVAGLESVLGFSGLKTQNPSSKTNVGRYFEYRVESHDYTVYTKDSDIAC